MLVDTREPLEIAQRLMELGMKVQIQELLVADYIEGQIGIERKSTDFTNFDDVESKIADLVRNFKWPYLIVDRSLGELIQHSRREPQQVYGYIASLVVRGVTPLFVDGMEGFCQVVVRIARKTYDGRPRYFTPTPIRPTPKLKDYKLAVLMALPDVSRTRARALLEHFESLKAVFNADVKELYDVEGIGKVLSNRIHTIVRDGK